MDEFDLLILLSKPVRSIWLVIGKGLSYVFMNRELFEAIMTKKTWSTKDLLYSIMYNPFPLQKRVLILGGQDNSTSSTEHVEVAI